MSPRTVFDRFRANLPLIAFAVSVLTALGVLANPVKALDHRVTTVEATLKDVGRWARASAIDLCLSRPDSVLARMDLNCRELLNR